MIKIAIASGKGGTGKTFFSTNLYKVMKQNGFNVGVIDCDAEVPNAALFLKGEELGTWPVKVFCPQMETEKCIYCAQCADICHFHAITCIPSAKYVKILPDLCHACQACLHVCPSGAIVPGAKEVGKVTAYGDNSHCHLIEARIKEGEHSPVPVIRDAIQHGEEIGWDYLILDAPPGCACPFVNTVKDADMVILITEPTPFGLSDLKHTVNVLRQFGKPYQVVINRADIGDGKVKDYLEAEHIGLMAEVPYSEQIASLYSQGKLAVEAELKMNQLFTRLMNKILQNESCNH